MDRPAAPTERIRLSDLQNREEGGLTCRHCGCHHFETVYTRPKEGCVVRLKACRHCGHRMLTRERPG
jgi:hypothetical protein